MTIAFPIEQFAGTVIGVLQAEITLQHVWDVVSNIKAGEVGHTPNGRAGRRRRDMPTATGIKPAAQENLGHLTQVKAASQDASGTPRLRVTLAQTPMGKKRRHPPLRLSSLTLSNACYQLSAL